MFVLFVFKELFQFQNRSRKHNFFPRVVFYPTANNTDNYDELFPLLKKIVVPENQIQKLVNYLRQVISMQNAKFNTVTEMDFNMDDWAGKSQRILLLLN